MTILTYHLQTKGKQAKEVYAKMSNKECGLQYMTKFKVFTVFSLAQLDWVGAVSNCAVVLF